MTKQRNFYRVCSRTSFLFAVTMIAGATACGDDEPDTTEGFANFRSINLSPGSPEVDILFNQGGEPVGENVEFAEGTDYREIATGTYSVQVVPEGANASETLASVQSITLESEASYTLLFFGNGPNYRAEIVQDSYDIAENFVHLRLAHVAEGLSPVGGFIVRNLSETERIVDALAYGEISDAVPVEEGSPNVALDTNQDGSPDRIFDLPELDDGILLNIFFVQNEDGDLIAVSQDNRSDTDEIEGSNFIDATTADVRFVHVAPAIGAVSVSSGNTSIGQNIGFLTATDNVRLSLGRQDVAVTLSGSGTEIARLEDVDVEDAGYTLALIGTPGNAILTNIENEADDAPSDQVRVRAIHGAPGVGEVDIWAIDAQGNSVELFSDLELAEASDSLEIAPGAYQLAVDTNDDGVLDLTFTAVDLQAGSDLNVYAIIDDAGDVSLAAQSASGMIQRISTSETP